jgi:zinc transport system substrate-binding protein
MYAAVALAVAAGPAMAAPAVVADIPPVHSLVARIMEGAGVPGLILPPGASPHGYAMRPSEARALSEADIVFWVGEGLTPWLGRSIGSLAGAAASVELMKADGVGLLETRGAAAFVDEDGHEHGEDEEHDHRDEHDHDEDHDNGDGHDRGLHDPHAWLDPENAKVWLGAIAGALAEDDPENADLYAANAAAGSAEIDALTARIQARLEPVRERPFVVLHDAYHYFEHRFDIEAAGSLAISDASDPGPARVAEIRDLIGSQGTVCVFAEPQFLGRAVGMITEGADVRTGILDPLGASLEPGPGLYPALLDGLAEALAGCLEKD